MNENEKNFEKHFEKHFGKSTLEIMEEYTGMRLKYEKVQKKIPL